MARTARAAVKANAMRPAARRFTGFPPDTRVWDLSFISFLRDHQFHNRTAALRRTWVKLGNKTSHGREDGELRRNFLSELSSESIRVLLRRDDQAARYCSKEAWSHGLPTLEISRAIALAIDFRGRARGVLSVSLSWV